MLKSSLATLLDHSNVSDRPVFFVIALYLRQWWIGKAGSNLALHESRLRRDVFPGHDDEIHCWWNLNLQKMSMFGEKSAILSQELSFQGTKDFQWRTDYYTTRKNNDNSLKMIRTTEKFRNFREMKMKKQRRGYGARSKMS